MIRKSKGLERNTLHKVSTFVESNKGERVFVRIKQISIIHFELQRIFVHNKYKLWKLTNTEHTRNMYYKLTKIMVFGGTGKILD